MSSNLMAFLNPKHACELAERVVIKLCNNAVDVNADAIDHQSQ
jgi:hypothetical protein